MGYALIQTQVQELPIIDDEAACGSIFPKVEDFLNMKSDHQNALKYVAARKNMDRYRCMIDFLFCEFFGKRFVASCFRYYDDEGPQLKELIAEEDRKRMELILVFALSRAYRYFCDKRRASWVSFVCETKKLLLAA